jgi:hypothetical protein
MLHLKKYRNYFEQSATVSYITTYVSLLTAIGFSYEVCISRDLRTINISMVSPGVAAYCVNRSMAQWEATGGIAQ